MILAHHAEGFWDANPEAPALLMFGCKASGETLEAPLAWVGHKIAQGFIELKTPKGQTYHAYWMPLEPGIYTDLKLLLKDQSKEAS